MSRALRRLRVVAAEHSVRLRLNVRGTLNVEAFLERRPRRFTRPKLTESRAREERVLVQIVGFSRVHHGFEIILDVLAQQFREVRIVLSRPPLSTVLELVL